VDIYKKCSICKRMISVDEFNKNKIAKDGLDTRCKECKRNANRIRMMDKNYRRRQSNLKKHRMHVLGIQKPMSENIGCSSYLGVYIAENKIDDLFDNLIKAPYGNRKYDFIDYNNKLYDVKSSILRYRKNANPYWEFTIRKNLYADYFICVAIDNRIDTNIMHMWIIPGDQINNKTTLHITNSDDILDKWREFEYELPIN